MTTRLCSTAVAVALLAVSLQGQQSAPAQPLTQGDGFHFKSGVELINVTATVSDATGRFVSGLRLEDFRVYEDDQPVEVTHFSAERVPVSLGIALDTSGSMVWPDRGAGPKKYLLHASLRGGRQPANILRH